MTKSFIIDPPTAPLSAGRAFVRHSRFRLRVDYAVKIKAVLEQLTDEQIWWRPNEDSNSIGNLILHLCGNARQWILAGVGGATDVRRRAAEFARRERPPAADLAATLDRTLDEVDAELARVDEALATASSDAPLQRACRPQGFDQAVLDVIFHVVEHFSYHTGQIVMLGKWHVGGLVRFYDEDRLNQDDAG